MPSALICPLVSSEICVEVNDNNCALSKLANCCVVKVPNKVLFKPLMMEGVKDDKSVPKLAKLVPKAAICWVDAVNELTAFKTCWVAP